MRSYTFYIHHTNAEVYKGYKQVWKPGHATMMNEPRNRDRDG
jgi:hypothetical protein